MTLPDPPPLLSDEQRFPPQWPHCGVGSDRRMNPVGCRGRVVEPHERCLAHLQTADQDTYISGLAPGDDVDLRGTTLTDAMLSALLDALRDPATGYPRFGTAQFAEVKFTDAAMFGSSTFTGDADFSKSISRGCNFEGATFHGQVLLEGARFSFSASFRGALFERAEKLGPLVCDRVLYLTGAVFSSPVVIEAAAYGVNCSRTRWAAATTLRLRYALVDLEDAVTEYPLIIMSQPSPFQIGLRPLDEDGLAFEDDDVKLGLIRGFNASCLTLINVSIRESRFIGAANLDQLQLSGDFTFASTPRGVYRGGLLPIHWTRRNAIAEERRWRAEIATNIRARDAWGNGGYDPLGVASTSAPRPAAIASVYRQLRKALEDGKNEPGAADFYYGEMEMRRYDKTRPRAERALITVYWAISGYGLRASRAISWLMCAMTVTVMLIMLWGLPMHAPKPAMTGRVERQKITLSTDLPAPVNPEGSLLSRVTTERWEESLRIVLNSVIFRSSGQELTTAGTYIEMGSRLTEPVLVGLAALAIRGRIKR
ncbi:pentapeptide repeat-containing protein [Streptomyces massasporeus]|uniref:pentapeptide repeat-containing protein n=1 Tax=Streptomyces massasporeus TaxID=67324 RepID=UPI003456EF7F